MAVSRGGPNKGAAAPLGKKALKKQENEAKNGTPLLMTKQFWYGSVAIFLIFGAGIMQFGMLMSDFIGKGGISVGGVRYIDSATDDASLREAFFGGEPHVLYCSGNKTEHGLVPQVVTDMAKMIHKDKKTAATNFITSNCFKPMKSGKTIAERFNFGKNEGFIAVFANDDPPVQLNYLQSAEYVVKQIKPQLKTGIVKIVYKKDWEKIRKKRSYLLLGAKSSVQITKMHEVYTPELKTYRKTRIASVDTSFWEINTSEEVKSVMPKEDPDYGLAMCVVKVGKGDGLPEDDEEEDGESKGVKEKTEEEKRAEAKKAFKEKAASAAAESDKPAAGKKSGKKWRIGYLKDWEGDAPGEFLRACGAGGDESWQVTDKRPEVRVIPSKPKVVKRPGRGRGGAAADAAVGGDDDGTRKGGKERIGRREEKSKEEEDDEDDEPAPGEGEEGGEEEEENLFGEEENSGETAGDEV
ncbi:unnamed protein product [Amoebophrya sp. A25]|nr:unnamed protein product [Amoebophrya sp. A25]|eukprot:GSA25T00000191001.1